jgi:hypothetical protein
MIPVHQSRISDRPIKKGAEDSSLKIKIELDLEVEVSRATPSIPSLLIYCTGRNLRPCEGRYNDWANVIPVGRALRKSEGRHNYRPTGQIFDVQYPHKTLTNLSLVSCETCRLVYELA